MNPDNTSVLKLQSMVFDEISFTRSGFQNDKRLELEFGFSFSETEDEDFIARIEVTGKKEEEYTLHVRLSGYFSLPKDADRRDTLMRKNTLAILFPYLRSEVTLLTAQPNVEPVVLPPMNVGNMLDDAMKQSSTKQ